MSPSLLSLLAFKAALSQTVLVFVHCSLYVADSNNNRVRKISPSGIITTVAGNGIAGFSGDGDPAIYAQLMSPHDVIVAADGRWAKGLIHSPATKMLKCAKLSQNLINILHTSAIQSKSCTCV